jgi:hypothetical protein
MGDAVDLAAFVADSAAADGCLFVLSSERVYSTPVRERVAAMWIAAWEVAGRAPPPPMLFLDDGLKLSAVPETALRGAGFVRIEALDPAPGASRVPKWRRRHEAFMEGCRLMAARLHGEAPQASPDTPAKGS